MRRLLLVSLITVFCFSACKKEEENGSENTTESGTGGSTEENNNTGGNSGGETSTLTLPSTYIIVNTDTMWLVTNNQNYDPSKFRYQINFGTRSQLQQNVDEAGQNSTLGLVLSFSAKPTTSAAFNYTSSRFSIANSQVNFYGSFFVGKGYSIEDKNYLSPSTGTLDLTIDNGKVSGTLPAMKLMDEADTTQTIDFKGEFDFNW